MLGGNLYPPKLDDWAAPIVGTIDKEGNFSINEDFKIPYTMSDFQSSDESEYKSIHLNITTSNESGSVLNDGRDRNTGSISSNGILAISKKGDYSSKNTSITLDPSLWIKNFQPFTNYKVQMRLCADGLPKESKINNKYDSVVSTNVYGTSKNGALKDLNGNILFKSSSVNFQDYIEWFMYKSRILSGVESPKLSQKICPKANGNSLAISQNKFNNNTKSSLNIKFINGYTDDFLIKTYLGTREKPCLYRRTVTNDTAKSEKDYKDFLSYTLPKINNKSMGTQTYLGGKYKKGDQKLGKDTATEDDDFYTYYLQETGHYKDKKNNRLYGLEEGLNTYSSQYEQLVTKAENILNNHEAITFLSAFSEPITQVSNSLSSLNQKTENLITAIKDYEVKENEIYKKNAEYVKKQNSKEQYYKKINSETSNKKAYTVTLNSQQNSSSNLSKSINYVANQLESAISNIDSIKEDIKSLKISKVIAYVNRFLYYALYHGGKTAINAFNIKSFSAVYGEEWNIYALIKKAFSKSYSSWSSDSVEKAVRDTVQNFFKDLGKGLNLNNYSFNSLSSLLLAFSSILSTDKLYTSYKNACSSAETAHKTALKAYNDAKKSLNKLKKEKNSLISQLKKLKGDIDKVYAGKDGEFSAVELINAIGSKTESWNNKIAWTNEKINKSDKKIANAQKEIDNIDGELSTLKDSIKSLKNELEKCADKIISEEYKLLEEMTDYGSNGVKNNLSKYNKNCYYYIQTGIPDYYSKISSNIGIGSKQKISDLIKTIKKEVIKNKDSVFDKYCPIMSKKNLLKLYHEVLNISYFNGTGKNDFYFDGYKALSILVTKNKNNKELNKFKDNLDILLNYIKKCLYEITYYQKSALLLIELYTLCDKKPSDDILKDYNGSKSEDKDEWLEIWCFKNKISSEANIFTQNNSQRKKIKNYLLNELNEREIIAVYSNLYLNHIKDKFAGNISISTKIVKSDQKKPSAKALEEFSDKYMYDWINDHAKNTSDWSTGCYIRAIAQPTFEYTAKNLSGVNGSNLNSLFYSGKKNSNNNIMYTYCSSKLEIKGNFHCKNKSNKEKERLASYEIILYDNNSENLESSGVLEPNNMNEINYSIQKELMDGKKYYVKIKYTTVNGYSSCFYSHIIKCSLRNYDDDIEVITRDQYPKLFPDLKNEIDFNLSSSAWLDNEEGRISLKFRNKYSDTRTPTIYKTNLCIRRADSKHNYKNWTDIKMVVCNNKSVDKLPVYYDYAIESGVTYIYGFQFVDENGIRSNTYYKQKVGQFETIENKKVTRDFHYGFLLGNNGKQLKLKFDQNLDDLTYNVGENKLETLGGVYPFIIKNANLKYRTFPINGTISYMMDDENTFTSNSYTTEKGVYDAPDFQQQYQSSATLSNYKKEYDFRQEVIKFLQDGKPKLYKSSTEGNILIRLMDIKFQPKNELSKMIYSFTSTAVEIGECSMENYQKYGFYTVGEYNTSFKSTKYITKLGQIKTTLKEDSDNYSTTNYTKLEDSNLLYKIVKKYNQTFDNEKQRVLRIHNLSLSFESDALYYKDNKFYDNIGDGGFFGYKINYNDKPIFISNQTQGAYNFGEDINFYYGYDDSNGKYGKNGKHDYIGIVKNTDTSRRNEEITVIADFLYDIEIVPQDEPKIISESTYSNLGQFSEYCAPGTDIYSQIYKKYYHKISGGSSKGLWGDTIVKITHLEYASIQAEPGAVFRIGGNDNIVIMNETGILTYDNLGEINTLVYLGMLDKDIRNAESNKKARIKDIYSVKGCDVTVDYIYQKSKIKYEEDNE